MTKTKALIILIFSLSLSIVNGQGFEDVIRYSQPQFNGTARAISMGGAFGSLGGDYSALSINPAGIATYRTSEFSFTPSLNQNNVSSSFNGITTKESNFDFDFNQIGYVGTYKPMRNVTKGIVSTHFAFGYSKNNNFDYQAIASGYNISNSMTDMLASNAYGYVHEDFYDNDYYPYSLTGIAYDSYLINYDLDADDGSYTSFLNPDDLVNQTKVISKDGYAGEINLNFGVNISNKILLGAGLNFAMLKYNEVTNYYEQFSEDNAENFLTFDNFGLRQYLDASGNGVNLKVGAIIKPLENLRLGIAYHSPTWYNMEENYGASVDVYFYDEVYYKDGVYYNYDPGEGELMHPTQGGSNYDSSYSYKFNTPEKVIASISYVIGKKAIISADYQYINYSSAKFKSDYDSYDDISYIQDLNDMISTEFTTTHNYNIGAEYRINSQFSARLGYSFLASPYKYEPKDNEVTSYSAGLGYRNKNFFMDFAYRLSQYSYSYYNYSWYVDDEFYSSPLTSCDINSSNYVMTMGWKF